MSEESAASNIEGYSGANLVRPGLEALRDLAAQGHIETVLLVVQFQGMIAEYERAQIIERSRRGKRHRAQQGTINVLSGGPYGYRYVKMRVNNQTQCRMH